MAKFNFPYHTFSTEYPESSFRAQLGGGYQFSAPPSAPDQRIFKLKFPGMRYYMKGMAIDRDRDPHLNLALLVDFYELHKTHATFEYPHPVYGSVMVAFNKPLKVPEGTKGGDGLVEGIELEFIERPGMTNSGLTDMIQVTYEDFQDVE